MITKYFGSDLRLASRLSSIISPTRASREIVPSEIFKLHQNEQVSRGMSIICRLPYGHDADGGKGNKVYPTNFKDKLPQTLQIFSTFSHLEHVFINDVNLNFQEGLKSIVRKCAILKSISLDGY